MYGRQPENIEAINQIFHRILAPYSANKVIKSFELWMARNQEFPTPADIVNLIKRNGKPPLSKEIYISLSKKEPEQRTHQDWEYIREYEESANDDFGSDFIDREKQNNFLLENNKLRKELSEAQNEINRLNNIIIGERESLVNRQQNGISLGDALGKLLESDQAKRKAA